MRYDAALPDPRWSGPGRIEGTPVVPRPARVADRRPFFPVSSRKFLVMSIGTLGFYEYYWAYRQWRRIRDRTGEHLRPFWRALFSPLYMAGLFRRVAAEAEAHGLRVGWPVRLSGLLYFVLSLAWRLPDPWWWVTMGSMLPCLLAVDTIARINARGASREPDNASFSRADVGVVMVGGLVLVLALVGTFMTS